MKKNYFIFLLTVLIYGYANSQNKEVSGNSGQRYIVAIGVSEFENDDKEIWKRPFAENDIRAFVDFFKSSKGGNVPDDNIKLLINKDATKSKIEKSIEKTLKNAEENDMVVIYFNGSGIKNQQKLGDINFLCYNTDLKDEAETTYPFSDLISLFRKYNNLKNILLFLDVDHNPMLSSISISEAEKKSMMSLMDSLKNVKFKDRQKFLQNRSISSDTNFVIFSSCEYPEMPLDDLDLKRSIFNYTLIEGLNANADNNNDSIITLREILDFTMLKVKERSQRKQNPSHFTRKLLNTVQISSLSKK